MRYLAFLLCAFQFSFAYAWTVDNQTALPVLAEHTGALPTPLIVASGQTLECSHDTFPGCHTSTGASELTRNVSVNVRVIQGSHSCAVTIPGDGSIEVKLNSLSLFQHHPSYGIPDEFTCEGSAVFNTETPTNGSCPYTVVDPYDDKCVVDSGTAGSIVEIVDVFPDTSRRHVRFLGTGDPQYDQSDGKEDARIESDQTLSSMNSDIANNHDIRGAIISGDLTQVAVESEFDYYKSAITPASEYYFEGLGNHDLLCAFYGADWVHEGNQAPTHSACGGRGGQAGEGGLTLSHLYDPPIPLDSAVTGFDPNVSDIMKDFVYDHTTQSGFPPRNRVNTYGDNPHYSWDWNDVHFIQLNLFPGTGVNLVTALDTHYIDPMDSLSFLAEDLARYAAPQDGSIGKPVVIIHHYPPDYDPSSPLDEMDVLQKTQYWNTMLNYNVVAILYGHAHMTNSHPNWGDFPFDQPVIATSRPDGRNSIPAFNLAAARGSDPYTDTGVYFDITMDCTNRMTLTQKNSDGTDSSSSRTINFCSSFPQTSCPSDPNYQNCDADLDGLTDKIEIDVAAGGACPDPAKKDSDGDGVDDMTEDNNTSIHNLSYRGDWDPSAGAVAYPGGALEGDLWNVTASGTGGTLGDFARDHTAGQRIIALTDNPATNADWLIADATILNGVYDSGTGEMNLCSTDTDGDGDLDGVDNCPRISNADQLDTDGDGIGNVCDSEMDDDGDGFDNSVDNCPAISNADQSNIDSDGMGDVCDDDMDNDGVPNVDDSHPTVVAQCRDEDSDFCDDCSQLKDGFGPLPDYDVTDDGLDTDGDGICNNGDDDSDGDGLTDEYEYDSFLNHLVFNRSEDNDNDGVNNYEEQMNGTDSNNWDHDYDGIRDGLDADPAFPSNLCSGVDDDVDQMITGHYPCATSNSVEVLSNTDVTDPGDLLVITPTTYFDPGFKVQAGGELMVFAEGPGGPVSAPVDNFGVPYVIAHGDCGGSNGETQYFELRFTPNPIGATPLANVDVELLYHADRDPGMPTGDNHVFFHQQSGDTSSIINRTSVLDSSLYDNDCTSEPVGGVYFDEADITRLLDFGNSIYLIWDFEAFLPADSGQFELYNFRLSNTAPP